MRYFSNSYFNHAAISFDKELNEWYAFARVKKSNILSSRLVRENLSRYIDKQGAVYCQIYKIPVSTKQYEMVRNIIKKIYNDKNYIYNYISIITYPILKGIKWNKSFTCVEFITYILKERLHLIIKKEPNRISPDELANDLQRYVCYRGDIAKYVKSLRKTHKDNGIYFDNFNINDIKVGIDAIQTTYKNCLI